MTPRDMKTTVVMALWVGVFIGRLVGLLGPWGWAACLVVLALWLLWDQVRRERREP